MTVHRKMLPLFLALCLMLGVVVFTGSAVVYADGISGSMRSSEESVTVGEQFTISIQLKGTDSFNGVYCDISYDPTLIDYEEGNFTGTSGSLIYNEVLSEETNDITLIATFTALAPESAAIAYTSQVWEYNEVVGSPAGSMEILVRRQEQYSGDNSLSFITTSYGTLSPAFEPEILEYTVEVPYEISSVSLSVGTNDAAATSSVNGASDVAVGENRRTITVEAENGDRKQYTVIIVRASQNESTQESEKTLPDDAPLIKVGKVSHYLISIPEEKQLPEGFERAQYEYEGTEYDIAATKGGLKLFYLTDYKGEEGGFYLYDETEAACFDSIPLWIGEKAYVLVDGKDLKESEIPEGYLPVNISLKVSSVLSTQHRELTVYAPGGADNRTEYFVPGYNEDGEKEFYLYNTRSGELRRYNGAVSPDAEKTEEEEEEQGSMSSAVVMDPAAEKLAMWLPVIACGLIVLVILLIVIIILITRGNRKKKSLKVSSSAFDDDVSLEERTMVLSFSPELDFEEVAPEDWREATMQVPLARMTDIHTMSAEDVTYKGPDSALVSGYTQVTPIIEDSMLPDEDQLPTWLAVKRSIERAESQAAEKGVKAAADGTTAENGVEAVDAVTRENGNVVAENGSDGKTKEHSEPQPQTSAAAAASPRGAGVRMVTARAATNPLMAAALRNNRKNTNAHVTTSTGSRSSSKGGLMADPEKQAALEELFSEKKKDKPVEKKSKMRVKPPEPATQDEPVVSQMTKAEAAESETVPKAETASEPEKVMKPVMSLARAVIFDEEPGEEYHLLPEEFFED